MPISVELGYMSDSDWNKVDKLIFRKIWPLVKEDTDLEESSYWVMKGPCLIATDEAQQLADAGVKLEVVPFPGNMSVKLKDRYPWESGAPQQVKDYVEGNAVQIVIPDMALMGVVEVTYLDDACTDQIQSYLDDGWRLLAVCPPNSQRRPDYIFGRTTKE